MITLAETCPRERQAGEQEGRRIGEREGYHKALLSERTDYVRLFWDEATSQAFRQRLSALDAALWPSLRALHTACQEGRDPLQLLVSRNGSAPGSKDDATSATT